MSIEIVVALIASCTSVVVAVVTLIVSVISTRSSSRSAKELERLRFELTQAAAEKTLLDKHTDESLAGLQVAIQAIQEIKDEVQLILAGIEARADSADPFERFNAARDRMLKQYETHLTSIEEGEAKLFHDAKNISVAITGWIHMAWTYANRGDQSDFLPTAKTKLEELRRRLSDIQQRLRDRRAEVMMKKLGIAPPVEAPHAEPAGLPPSALEDSPPAPEVLIEGLSVLVVDDEPEVREMIRLLFTRQGAEVTECGRADEALDELRRGDFHVLLSDISLPGDDGYQLIRRLRRLPPEQGGNILAIAVTGYGSDADRQRALIAGFDVHVTKPADPNDLLNLIRRLLGRAGASV